MPINNTPPAPFSRTVAYLRKSRADGYLSEIEKEKREE